MHLWSQLCAGMQVDAAAKSVHAQVMDPEGKVLREDGDLQLRRSYSANMQRLMQQAGARPVQDVVDMGCATGGALQQCAILSLRWLSFRSNLCKDECQPYAACHPAILLLTQVDPFASCLHMIQKCSHF